MTMMCNFSERKRSKEKRGNLCCVTSACFKNINPSLVIPVFKSKLCLRLLYRISLDFKLKMKMFELISTAHFYVVSVLHLISADIHGSVLNRDSKTQTLLSCGMLQAGLKTDSN